MSDLGPGTERIHLPERWAVLEQALVEMAADIVWGSETSETSSGPGGSLE